MKNSINIAVIGLGQRGSTLLNNILLNMDDINVVGICDVYEDRNEAAAKDVTDKKGITPFTTTDYKKIFEIKNLDAVYVSSAWEYHTEISIYALKKGVAVAMEVGGAYSQEELWELVHTCETTNTPFMFMENCCFNKTEVLATNMAKKGLFGTIVHASGSYSHDLREEIAGGNKNRHYRLRNYLNRNCDNYPTHDVGPIAFLLDINRGNKFVSLVSVASKACGLKEYVENNKEKYPELVGKEFAQGDIVDTIIKCAGGETIFLKLDTTLPRFYARDFTVRGTKGFYEQNTNFVYLESENSEEIWDTEKIYYNMHNNAERFKEYLPDRWKTITEEEIVSGHGGMDYLEFRKFAECLKSGKEMPIDVYDAAAWMEISILTERSIANNGTPELCTDFTCGKWLTRKPITPNDIMPKD